MAYRVLIPQDIVAEGKKYLSERGYEYQLGSGLSVDILKEEVMDCDAILARTAQFPAAVLEAGPKLRVVGRHGVGVDNIDFRRAEELGIFVTNTPLANAGSVAEHTIGLVIALARNFVRSDVSVRSGNWEKRNELMGVDLEAKTLGVLGLGRVGRQVAKKAALGLGMRVIGYDPYVTQADVPDVEILPDMDAVFSTADFISLHLPSMQETKGIVGARLLDLMKSSAFLINAARGDIVNEKELIEALQTDRIAGAGLDVLDEEPPGQDNPLFAMQNVILTPHSAALTKECMARMATQAAMGIDEVLSGKKPSWPVNNPKNPRS